MNLKQLDKFHQTRTGYIVFGLVELALSYLFFGLAVNSGSLWQWALVFVLFIGFSQNFAKLIGTLIRGNKAS